MVSRSAAPGFLRPASFFPLPSFVLRRLRCQLGRLRCQLGRLRVHLGGITGAIARKSRPRSENRPAGYAGGPLPATAGD